MSDKIIKPTSYIAVKKRQKQFLKITNMTTELKNNMLEYTKNLMDRVADEENI